jgi:carboxyl-terminal processing protease
MVFLMISRLFFLRGLIGVIFFWALFWGPSAARLSAAEPVVAQTAPLTSTGYLEKVSDLVRDQNIAALAALTPPPGDDPMVAQVDQWRKQYVQVMQQQAAQTNQLYTQQIKLTQQTLKQNDFIDAVHHFYNAYEAAPDQLAFLKLPWVQQVTAQIAARAAADDVNQHWLEEFELYYNLDTIYSISMLFHDQVQKITHRIALLSTYTPAQFFKMQESFSQTTAPATQPAAQPGTNRPAATGPSSQPSATGALPSLQLNSQDPFHIAMPNFPTWQSVLDGIREDMMFQALEVTYEDYVKPITYNKLAVGGLTALRLLADTDALADADSFSGLKDSDARNKFLSEIDSEFIIARSSNPMDSDDLIDMWSRIVRTDMDTVNIPVVVLVKEFTEGSMDQLDPFSEVFWPSELAEFMKQIQGSFGGVGIQIEMRGGLLTVISPLSGSPAYDAGIQPADIIATVDGKSTIGITVDQAVNEITGKPGTTVTLGIRRGNNPKLLIFPLQRAEIQVKSINGISRDPVTNNWNYMIDPQYGIGYIRVTQFQDDTADELLVALNDLTSRHVRGIIIDLRDNPGGLLETCIHMCDMFLTQGTIVSTRGRSSPLEVQTADGAPLLPPDVPMIILVNQNSASASEIFSGAMHDLQRALIVGHQSFGKGLVQNEIYLNEDQSAMMKLTMADYYLPKGESIQRQPYAVKWGVQPDVKVPFSPAQSEDLELTWEINDIIRGKNAPPSTQPATQPARDAATMQEKFDTQLDTALMLMRLQLVQTD